MKFTPRAYQQEAHDSVIDYFKTCTSPCLIEAATGAGKSLIISMIAETLHNLSGGKRVLCLAPSAELVTQNAEKFKTTGYPFSIYSASAGQKSLRHPVVFATPITFKKVARRLAHEFTGVVIDECFSRDTLIKTIDGWIKISDPDIRNKKLACFDEKSGKVLFDYPRKAWSNGIRNITLIKHAEGEFKCTSTHRIYSKGLWVEAQNLKIGQKILLEDSQANVTTKLLRAFAAVGAKLYLAATKKTPQG